MVSRCSRKAVTNATSILCSVATHIQQRRAPGADMATSTLAQAACDLRPSEYVMLILLGRASHLKRSPNRSAETIDAASRVASDRFRDERVPGTAYCKAQVAPLISGIWLSVSPGRPRPNQQMGSVLGTHCWDSRERMATRTSAVGPANCLRGQ